MMRMSNKFSGFSTTNNTATVTGPRESSLEKWEVRPCGIVVQKRLDNDHNIKHPPNIRVRVKFGLSYHEIHISSQATFGELKKKLSGPTGLHHEDQKIYYKDKERDSKQFLDIVGVKDKSKMVLVENPISQEKRYLEMKRTAVMEKAAKSISQISLNVDKLASQVATLESVILKGERVSEKEIASLIELLMNELIKLDGIVAEGDAKLHRNIQVRRVQNYVETLDMVKARNSMPSGKPLLPPPDQLSRRTIWNSQLRPRVYQDQKSSHSSSAGITVVSTQWETFDSTPSLCSL